MRLRTAVPLLKHVIGMLALDTGKYGTTNDVGIAFPPGRSPIVIAVLSTKSVQGAPADEPLLAKTAELVEGAFHGR